MARCDLTGKTVEVDERGLVRIDQVPAFRVNTRDGVVYIEFIDRDRMRASCKGSRYVEIPLDVLYNKLKPRD